MATQLTVDRILSRLRTYGITVASVEGQVWVYQTDGFRAGFWTLEREAQGHSTCRSES